LPQPKTAQNRQSEGFLTTPKKYQLGRPRGSAFQHCSLRIQWIPGTFSGALKLGNGANGAPGSAPANAVFSGQGFGLLWNPLGFFTNNGVASGKHTKNYGKSPFLMGKSPFLMGI
jgi:hypothetical protein